MKEFDKEKAEPKKVLVVDADSHNDFPNLALMKLSSWLKEINNGDIQIDLIKGVPDTAPLEPYDMTYVSCIYHQNKEKVQAYLNQLQNYAVGGSGINYEWLPEPIEHIIPDYSLYNIDYSMGFTSRGCIRNCGFCIVPKKEGAIKDHASITEFLHPTHTKIMILDNNFLASPKWKENLELMNGLRVNFNQGLDIRLVTEENAQLLAETKYYSWNFKTRGLHFALDDMRYLWEALDGIQILLDAGIKPHHLMFYVLIGWNTYPDEDVFRVNLLKSYGIHPYIMTFDQIENQWTKNFERYINGRYHEFVPFEKYNNGVLCEPFLFPWEQSLQEWE